MFYNYLIFNMVTLSLRILLKYCVSLLKNKSFILVTNKLFYLIGGKYTYSLDHS